MHQILVFYNDLNQPFYHKHHILSFKKNHNSSSSYIYRIVANKPRFIRNIIIYKYNYNTPKIL
ncbi:hypothetical protein COK84_26355 [Bacillus thuringiensis]|nr:hypothetical protein COK84_26355 [Bacillus thuringiensis]